MRTSRVTARARFDLEGLRLARILEALGDRQRVGPRGKAHVEAAIHIERAVGLYGVALRLIALAEHHGDGLAGNRNGRFRDCQGSAHARTLTVRVAQAHPHRGGFAGARVDYTHRQDTLAAHLGELHEGAGEERRRNQPQEGTMGFHFAGKYIK